MAAGKSIGGAYAGIVDATNGLTVAGADELEPIRHRGGISTPDRACL